MRSAIPLAAFVVAGLVSAHAHAIECAGLPTYSAGTAYSTGQDVQNNGSAYHCEVGGWCSSTSAFYYEPGAGLAWEQAWSLLGSCDAGGGGTQDTQAPTAPGTPAFSSISTTSATASWAAASDNVGVSGYEVTVGGASFSTTSTSTALNGLTANTSYAVSVVAYDAAGLRSAASSASFTTAGDPPPPPPPDGGSVDAGLTVVDLDSVRFYVTAANWADVHFALNGSDEQNFRMTAANGQQEYTLNGLNSGDTLNYWFTYDNGGGAVDTTSQSYTHAGGGGSQDTQAPTAPGTPAFANVTADSADVSWAAASDNVGVTGYEVTTNGTTQTVTGTAASLSGLTADTAYAVSVVALDAAGLRSSPSSASFTTAGNPPPPPPPSGGDGLPFCVTDTFDTFVSGSYPIEGTTTVSVDIEGIDPSVMEAADSFNLYYRLNGGARVAISTNTDGFARRTDSVSFSASGSVVIEAEATTSAANETYCLYGISVDTGSGPAPDTQAPSAPGTLGFSNVTTTSADVSWAPASDNVGVTGYEVTANGTTHSVTGTSASLSDLAADTTYSVSVVALDAAGLRSTASSASFSTPGDPPPPPSGGGGLPFCVSDTTDSFVSDSYPIDGTATVSVDIEGIDPSVMEAADSFNLYYRLNGGARVAVSTNNDGFARRTDSVTVSGSGSLVIEAEATTSAANETYCLYGINVVTDDDGGDGGDGDPGDGNTGGGGDLPGWTLIWSDEFNGTGMPDPANWNYHVGNGFNAGINAFDGWGNQELQWYRPENCYQQGGNLVIHGEQDPITVNGRTWDYRSCRITTQGKHSWRYGRIEARIASPSLQGKWNAFWLLGDSIDSTFTTDYNAPLSHYDYMAQNWSSCGEVDIFENVNEDTFSFHANFWDQRIGVFPYDPANIAHYSGQGAIGNPEDFHVYALEWDETEQRFYIDGVLTHVVDITPATLEEFHKPMHILFNMALGGQLTFGYNPIPSQWPRDTLVDYVRVYQADGTDGGDHGGGDGGTGGGDGGTGDGGGDTGSFDPGSPVAGGTHPRLTIKNACTTETMWVKWLTVPGYLGGFFDAPNHTPVGPGGSITYNIPDKGLAAMRFWPAYRCDASGKNCEIGASGGPPEFGFTCPPEGCAPPIDSKFEATFGCITGIDDGQCQTNPSGNGAPLGRADWWNSSAVDGFTVPMKVEVKGYCPVGPITSGPFGGPGGPAGGVIDCSALNVDQCPTNADLSTEGQFPFLSSVNLVATNPATGNAVGCYSPAGKLTYSNWGNAPTFAPEEPEAQMYTCPTPPVSEPECRAGPADRSAYRNYIHSVCPTYAYAYDDGFGLSNCPASTLTTYEVTFNCP